MILSRNNLLKGGRVFMPASSFVKKEDRVRDEDGKDVVETKPERTIAAGIVNEKPKMERIIAKLEKLKPLKKKRIAFVPKIRKDAMP